MGRGQLIDSNWMKHELEKSYSELFKMKRISVASKKRGLFFVKNYF